MYTEGVWTTLEFRLRAAMPADEQTHSAPIYEDRPSLRNGALVGLQGGGVGVLVASVQNALDHHNRGAMGILTRSGGTIGFFGQLGCLFFFDLYSRVLMFP